MEDKPDVVSSAPMPLHHSESKVADVSVADAKAAAAAAPAEEQAEEQVEEVAKPAKSSKKRK